MFSISQLRRHLFPIFSLMKDTGITMQVVYKGVVYNLNVVATKENPKRHRAHKQRKGGATVQSLPATPCPECDSLMFAGICMNSACPTNS